MFLVQRIKLWKPCITCRLLCLCFQNKPFACFLLTRSLKTYAKLQKSLFRKGLDLQRVTLLKKRLQDRCFGTIFWQVNSERVSCFADAISTKFSSSTISFFWSMSVTATSVCHFSLLFKIASVVASLILNKSSGISGLSVYVLLSEIFGFMTWIYSFFPAPLI